MTTVPLAFLISLILALTVTPLVIQLARRVGAIDRGTGSARKIHGSDTPRLGGVAIVLAFYAPLVLLLFVDSAVGERFSEETIMVVGLMGGGAAIALLGVFDDIIGASAKQKLAVQVAVAIGLYLLGFRIESVSYPFGDRLSLGVFSAPITCLWIVGVINAVNLIDGLDGLASGVCLLAATTMLVIASATEQVVMMLFMACLTGSLIGFLVYNFNPARIFMGDTGSMFLGFVLAVTTVQTNTKSEATVALLVPVLALGLPLMDTTLAMTRRLLTGRGIFSADRGHLHHRLLDRGLSHRNAVLVLYGMALLLCLAALVVTISVTVVGPMAVLLAALVASAILIRWLHDSSGLPLGKQARELVRLRTYNRELLQRAPEAASELSRAGSLSEIWDATVTACAPLRPASMYLLAVDHGERPDEHKQLCVWRSSDNPTELTFSAAYPIDIAEGRTALLELYWKDGRGELSDAELAHLDQLVEQLEGPLSRHIDMERGDLIVLRTRPSSKIPAQPEGAADE